MSVTINASTSTGLVQSADTSGEIELQSNGTTALKVNTNEGIQILNCLGVGNATPSTSGAGITFPATQSASSDANTLDDYEEGTWTPTVTNAGLTSYTSSGSYTKIGNLVYLTATVNVTNKGTASGTLTISGSPFSVTTTSVGGWRDDTTGTFGSTLRESTSFYLPNVVWANDRWYANVVYLTS
jgi:hypothetical protein